jgi:hypothetical protein
MADVMSADEQSPTVVPNALTALRRAGRRSALVADQARAAYRTIIIVGGGCYGSYYLRQLGRARAAGAIAWQHLVVVDRDAGCRAAQTSDHGAQVVIRDWSGFFADFLDGAALDPAGSAADAIVPSPLMPHLLFDWIVRRARARWPQRTATVRPLPAPPAVPWQRASADGATHYVSFAEWMCPINCIEPARCPATRGERGWTMPAAIRDFVSSERARGHDLGGPFVFHCTHRSYGVGMVDVGPVIAADAEIRILGDAGPADVIIGTMSHCHGALGRLEIG